MALPAKVYGATEFAYLTDAVPSTISSQLAKVGGLDTKLPPSSFDVDRLKGDLNRLADSYQVSTFVVSSITSEAGSFVLDVQLVDARSRKVLWSDQFQGARGEYLEMARRAAEGIRRAARPEAVALAAAPVGPDASEAELALQQGRYYSNRYNNRREMGDFDVALASFKRALELDPNLAGAAAEISLLYIFRLESDPALRETMLQAIDDWSQRALAIDPRCGKAWAAVSYAGGERSSPDLAAVRAASLRAVFFDPHSGVNFIALGNSLQSSARLSRLAALEATRAEPLYLYGYSNHSDYLRRLNHHVEALRSADHALSIDEGMALGIYMKALALLDLGRLDEVPALVAQVDASIQAGAFPDYLSSILNLNWALERRDQGATRRYSERVLRHISSPETTAQMATTIWQATVAPLARHGELEFALDILRRCSEAGVVVEYDWLLENEDIAPLRADPRFQPILTRAREQFDGLVADLDAAKARGELPPFLEQPLANLLRELNYQRPAEQSLKQTG